MSAIMAMSAPKPYGIKALRQMRERREPSERLSRKISQTYDYFVEKVDPIIGACITHLLCDQPTDILGAMLTFLSAFQANEIIPPRIGDHAGRPRRELKVFLATSIGPVIAKLVNRIAVEKPSDVIGFMTTEIQHMIDSPEPVPAPVVSDPVPTPNKSKKQEERAPEPVEEKNIQLAVLGLGGVGKSSILNMLQGKFDSKIRPTIGFRPVSMMLSEDTKIRFYDLGGGKKIRDIWTQYYHDVHGVIFVVDGTAASDEMQLTIETMAHTLNHEYLAGKPLLIMINKQDAPNALSVSDAEEVLRNAIKFPDGVKFAGCSSLVPAEIPEDFAPDVRIEAALMTLLDAVLASFKGLNDRVVVDCKRKSEEEVRQRVAKERKVLKNKIASAFLSSCDPAYIAAHQIEEEPANIFSEEEGLTYLASEIGEDVPGLSDLAKQVGALVGYQKLALTIIGGLKAPVSKKKVPMTWPQIHEMVVDLRKELCIPM